MKQLLALVLCFVSMLGSAQSPQTISYQAILRDNVSALIQNANNVAVHVSIIQGALIENNIVYVEDHNTTTNANGLFTIEIGNGAASAGNYPSIQWGAGPFFLKTEIDPLGGTNYLITAISELLSVPFANYANQAGRHPGVAGLLEGHWQPIVDNIQTGTIFIQFISSTSIMLSYYGLNGDNEYQWYNEVLLVQGSSLVSPFGLSVPFEFTVNATQLTITIDDGGDLFTSTYERQF
jgi:hypothetical protein